VRTRLKVTAQMHNYVKMQPSKPKIQLKLLPLLHTPTAHSPFHYLTTLKPSISNALPHIQAFFAIRTSGYSLGTLRIVNSIFPPCNRRTASHYITHSPLLQPHSTPRGQAGSQVQKVKRFDFRKCLFVCFWRDSPPPVDQGLLIHEVSRSHTMTHHSR
jgi:hypothetical protein